MIKSNFSFFIILLLFIFLVYFRIIKRKTRLNLNPINFETFETSNNAGFDEEKIIFTNPFTLKYYPHFLDNNEIDACLNMCDKLFKDSTVTAAKDKNVKDSSRTSQSCFLPANQNENPAIMSIKKKVHQLTGFPIENIEGLQVVKYQPGQQYKSHYDWFEKGNYDLKQGNRKATFFCYLNDDFEGGETFFPKMNFRKKGRKGSALYWPNMNKTGDVDYNTLHAGLPVNSGTKYGLNIWVREHKF